MLRKVECKFCDFLAGCCSSRPRSSRPRSSESRRSSHTQCQMKGPSPVRSACRSASVEQGDWTNGYCKFERQCNGNLARVLLDRACVLQGQFRVRRVSRQSPAPSHKTTAHVRHPTGLLQGRLRWTAVRHVPQPARSPPTISLESPPLPFPSFPLLRFIRLFLVQRVHCALKLHVEITSLFLLLSVMGSPAQS